MKFVSVGSSPLMRLGLLSGLKRMGHETDHFPHHNWMKLDENIGSELLARYIGQYKPDYLIFGGYAPKYFGEIPALCHKYGAGFIYWAIEDPVGFDNTLFMARQADYVFTTAQECIPKYKEKGIDARLLLFACNPDYHKAGRYCAEYDVDMALAASFYSWAPRMKGYEIILKAAKESGGSLKIWGAGWNSERGKKALGEPKLYCGYLANSRLPDLCASAKIILGVQCDDTSVTQTSMRPYEVLGCKGFHLTQWTKATVHIFEDNKHLVTARNREEAIEKTKYYIGHPSDRARIAQKGQEYVYKYHTYDQRVREILLPFLKAK